MSRARLIKPGFFTNEDVVQLPPETQLLFIGLWTLADKEGYLEDRPLRIKMQIFPASSYNVDQMLNELYDAKLVIRYTAKGKPYLYIPGFLNHQKPHPNETPSVIPPYVEGVEESRNYTSEQHQNTSTPEKEIPAQPLIPIPIPDSLAVSNTPPSEGIAAAVETDLAAAPVAPVPRKPRQNPASEPWLSIFEQAYGLIKGLPYKRQRGDFVQLAEFVKAMGDWLTPEEFAKGVANYFSSDIGRHTLADLCNRFGDFYKSPLDRFKVPIARPESVNGAPTRRESENERKRRENRESIAADYTAIGDHQAAAAVLAGDSGYFDTRRTGGTAVDGKLLGEGSS